MAIDHYQARLVQAKDQERAFFADASHELRTPMAVVRGAVDVLSDDDKADGEQRKRLRRLERGMSELTDKADAMFVLARQNLDPEEAVDLAALLTECIDDLQMHLPDETDIEVSLSPGQTLHAPRRQALLVLRLLLRSVIAAGAAGRLSVMADRHVITIRFGPQPDSRMLQHDQTLTRSDLQLGLTLTGRLATAMGWTVRGALIGSERTIEVDIA